MVFWTVYVTGRLATTERLAPSETADGIEVPVIGTVGDFPEPEHRVVVNVTADGRVTIDGAVFTDYFALVADLQRRAGSARGPDAENLVLRVDRRAPWGIGQLLLRACDGSGFRRVFFAVRH